MVFWRRNLVSATRTVRLRPRLEFLEGRLAPAALLDPLLETPGPEAAPQTAFVLYGPDPSPSVPRDLPPAILPGPQALGVPPSGPPASEHVDQVFQDYASSETDLPPSTGHDDPFREMIGAVAGGLPTVQYSTRTLPLYARPFVQEAFPSPLERHPEAKPFLGSPGVGGEEETLSEFLAFLISAETAEPPQGATAPPVSVETGNGEGESQPPEQETRLPADLPLLESNPVLADSMPEHIPTLEIGGVESAAEGRLGWLPCAAALIPLGIPNRALRPPTFGRRRDRGPINRPRGTAGPPSPTRKGMRKKQGRWLPCFFHFHELPLHIALRGILAAQRVHYRL